MEAVVEVVWSEIAVAVLSSGGDVRRCDEVKQKRKERLHSVGVTCTSFTTRATLPSSCTIRRFLGKEMSIQVARLIALESNAQTPAFASVREVAGHPAANGMTEKSLLHTVINLHTPHQSCERPSKSTVRVV